MLLGTLAAGILGGILGNALTGKGVIKTSEGVTKAG